ncbi:MAG: DUF4079 family protein [Archangium sp.]|nr:DUF4079 family protein [Archangium sp.]
MKELLVYAHPALAAVAILLAFIVYRDGFAQRKLRLRKITPPEGSYARHLKLAPWNAALIITAAIGGLISAVALREWKPFDTLHGWFGVTTAVLFTLMWWLGRKLIRGQKHVAERHGLIGLLALFAAGITGVLGISLLP